MHEWVGACACVGCFTITSRFSSARGQGAPGGWHLGLPGLFFSPGPQVLVGVVLARPAGCNFPLGAQVMPLSPANPALQGMAPPLESTPGRA